MELEKIRKLKLEMEKNILLCIAQETGHFKERTEIDIDNVSVSFYPMQNFGSTKVDHIISDVNIEIKI